MVLVLVEILKSLAEMVPLISQIFQRDLICVGYSDGTKNRQTQTGPAWILDNPTVTGDSHLSALVSQVVCWSA